MTRASHATRSSARAIVSQGSRNHASGHRPPRERYEDKRAALLERHERRVRAMNLEWGDEPELRSSLERIEDDLAW